MSAAAERLPTIAEVRRPQDGAVGAVQIIDQTHLPHRLVTVDLHTAPDAAHAIRDMLVRGAPLIGATAAYGMALGLRERADDAAVSQLVSMLTATRPTAVNLRWALDRVARAVRSAPQEVREATAWDMAAEITAEDAAINRAIGEAGLPILQALSEANGKRPLNILTHCNAGRLATVDWGTATAPIYLAHQAGLAVHVWVDETRPRNQGAALTAWELAEAGVPHTVIADNAGGHLMRHGMVDLVIVGTDRTAANGDVCNKIGTYLKAVAAHDNSVPFYVALPSPTIDFSLASGDGIPIEERGAEEVTHIAGKAPDGTVTRVQLTPDGTAAANFAFDVTPARLVTGLITERGVASASVEGIKRLFPAESAAAA